MLHLFNDGRAASHVGGWSGIHCQHSNVGGMGLIVVFLLVLLQNYFNANKANQLIRNRMQKVQSWRWTGEKERKMMHGTGVVTRLCVV